MKCCHVFAALALAAALALDGPAHAQSTFYDQQDTAASDADVFLIGSGTVGQSFVPTASAMDTATFMINVSHNQTGGSGEVARLTVQVLAGAGLDGQVLGQSNAVLAQPVDAGGTITFTFPAAVALTPGSTYTLAVVFGGTSAPDVVVVVSGTHADSYAHGQEYGSGNNNGNTPPADFYFQEGITYPSSVTAVHTFTGGDGGEPEAAVIQANDGNLYGTTSSSNGTGTDGTVFMVSTDGTGFQTVHLFTDAEGTVPEAALLQASDGNLYGTTLKGGADGGGTVFEVSTDGTAFQSVHSFIGPDGAFPEAGLLQASDGNLYGTTYSGGANGNGTVFEVSTDGTTFQTLHSFNFNDGKRPEVGLLQASDGYLYGATNQGGANGNGTVFKVSTDGTTFQTLHSFTSADGGFPEAGLLQASDGNLYGTTNQGGATGEGTVFKVSTDGMTFQTLHSFTGPDGENPDAGVIQASDGNLYGTTAGGGANGDGTVFMVSTDGTTFQTLYGFGSVSGEGENPEAGLLQASDGNLYGTTEDDSALGYGEVFQAAVSLPNVVQFHMAINSVNETAGTASVRVDRIGYDGSGELVVLYTLSDGTAQVNTDYTDGSGGSLEWRGSDTTPKFITVNIVNRGFTDGSLRTLSLTLYDPVEVGGSGTAVDYPQTATLTINGSIPGAPVVTSAATATGTTSQAFSYQIAASASPTRYGVTGLPMGLSVGRKTGTITGTPQVPGTFTLTLNAYNKAGQGSKTLTLTVADGPPDVTSAGTASYTIGADFSYQITADHHPTAFGVTGLPPGLSVNAQTGLITGQPKTAGTDTLTLNAYNAAGKGSQTLTLAQTPPTVTSAATAQATQGASFSYQITAEGNPTLFGVYGLPDGLTVNAQTGVVSGQSKFAGTFAMTLNAYNSGGKGSQSLTLTVAASVPVITSAATDNATVGTAYSYQITASNVPTDYGVTGLPPGLSVSAQTGLIAGTPKKAGTYTLTLNAYNPAGKGSGTLTLTITGG